MRRWRLFLLLLALPLYTWGLMFLAMAAYGLLSALASDIDLADLNLSDLTSPAVWREDVFGSRDGLLTVVAPAVLVTLTQVIFVLPMVRPAAMGRGRAKPPLRTMIACGLVGGLLVTGTFLALLELLELPDTSGSAVERADPALVDQVGLFGMLWVCVVIGWALWTPLLIIFARRGNPRRLHERLIVLLLGGTILETLVVIPIDIMVRRRTDCYCFTGTFFALCISVWAWLWLAGPGIILALTSKRRRLWAQTHCWRCGYRKGPSPGANCPECGGAWHDA